MLSQREWTYFEWPLRGRAGIPEPRVHEGGCCNGLDVQGNPEIRRRHHRREKRAGGRRAGGARPYTVWRAWTFDGEEYNAHYVVAEEGSKDLSLYYNFQPFANWLMRAFNVKDTHARRLEWFRSAIAAVITLTLLALLVWAVLKGQAAGADYKWLAGALAATSLGYLLGGWTRRVS